MSYAIAIIAGYLLGSLPFGYWLGRMRGVDLRAVGTGNPGAANMWWEVSKPMAVLVTALDAAKGSGAALVGMALGLDPAASLAPGAAAVVGHLHSPLLNLRGGAGLATVIGVAMAVSPVAGAVGLAVGVLMTAVGRNVGRGAGFGHTAYLGAAAGLGEDWPVIAGVIALGAAILARALLLDRRRIHRPVH